MLFWSRKKKLRPKWQFGPRYFYNFSTYFFLEVCENRWDRNTISVLKKKGPKWYFDSYDFCKKKSNHVGFIKIFFLIMVYKKNYFLCLERNLLTENIVRGY